MIDSYTATSVIACFLLIFGIVLPIIDKIPLIKNFISLRWTIVVVYSALCIGVIIDFEHLDTSVRFAVVVGGILLSAIFLIVRSIEKAFVNKWAFPHARASLSKGDVQAEFSVNPKMKVKQSNLSNFVKSKQNDSQENELNDCVLFTDNSSFESNFKSKTEEEKEEKIIKELSK